MLSKSHILILALVGVAVCANTEIEELKKCLKTVSGSKAYDFLPGKGWDNLQNTDMKSVVKHTYTSCSTTKNGQYILPNGVEEVEASEEPNLEVLVQMYSIESYMNYYSATAKELNKSPGLTIKSVALSGSFSEEYMKIQETQLANNATTMVIELRAHRFATNLTKPVLSDHFKAQVNAILKAIKKNDVNLARHEAAKLVTDFGTHVVTKETSGAGLKFFIYMNKEFLKFTDQMERHAFGEAKDAIWDAFKKGNLNNVEYFKSSNKKYFVKATITTTDGEVFDRNLKYDDWKALWDQNMIVMAREGKPLYSFIEAGMIPGVSKKNFIKMIDIIQQTVEGYYMLNTEKGITDPDCKYFDPTANVADERGCVDEVKPFRFMGFFGTCTFTGATHVISSEEKMTCNLMSVVNPKTRNESCPLDNIALTLRHTITKYTKIEEKCESKLWFFTDCVRTKYTYYRESKWYWCAPITSDPDNPGFMFGGFYSTDIANSVTGDRNCPEYFWDTRFIDDISICLSEEFDKNVTDLMFGGFFHSKSGNPFAVSKKSDQIDKSKRAVQNETDLPKECPEGYRQVTTPVAEGLLLYYCMIENNTVKGEKKRLPVIILGTWKDPKYKASTSDGQVNDPGTLTFAVIGVLGTVYFVGLTIGAVYTGFAAKKVYENYKNRDINETGVESRTAEQFIPQQNKSQLDNLDTERFSSRTFEDRSAKRLKSI